MDRFVREFMQGYSLIEMIVVILIISVLALVINLTWPGTTLQLGAQTEQMATDIRYTQALSMTQGYRYCLVIAANTYQIINSTTGSATPFASGNNTVTLGSGISFGTLVPSSAAMFIFDGKGQPYYSTSTTCNTTNATAATSLSSTASIPLTSSGQTTRTITINSDTGSVLVQ